MRLTRSHPVPHSPSNPRPRQQTFPESSRIQIRALQALRFECKSLRCFDFFSHVCHWAGGDLIIAVDTFGIFEVARLAGLGASAREVGLFIQCRLTTPNAKVAISSPITTQSVRKRLNITYRGIKYIPARPAITASIT